MADALPKQFTRGVRDLTFVPIGGRGSRTLGASRIASYNEHGFVSPIRVFDRHEARDIREYFDALIDEVVSANDCRNGYSINCYHLVCRGVYDLATEPRILDLVEDVLGPDLVCWGTHLFCKLPRDGMDVPLHQDAVYWPFTTTRTVTVWLAIDDVDTENAAMQFVPGSHRLGPLEHEALPLDGSRVLGRRVKDLDRFANRFDNVLNAGDVSLHSDLLLHGSRANESDRRRAGLTLRYGAVDLRVEPGWEHWIAPSVHVSGRADEYWPNRRRPDGEHPEQMREFSGEFDGNPA